MGEKAVEPDDRGASGSADEEEAFSDAFDEKLEVKVADPPAAADEKPPEKVEEAPVKPVEKPVEKAADPPEDFKQQYKTLQGIHKHDKETWEEEKARLLAENESLKKPKEEKPKVEMHIEVAEEVAETLTPEEKEQLASYEEDFDVVSKMEGMKREKALKGLEKRISTWMTNIEKKVEERILAAQTQVEAKIEPVKKIVDERERDVHFEAIRKGYTAEDGTVVPGHDDFENYVKDGSVKKWIESKPKYMQPALMHTYTKGSVSDVVDMLTDFKKENGIENVPATDNVVRIDRKVERKKALKSVDARPVAVHSGKGLADDYEGAFEEALAKKSGG